MLRGTMPHPRTQYILRCLVDYVTKDFMLQRHIVGGSSNSLGINASFAAAVHMNGITLYLLNDGRNQPARLLMYV